MQSAISGRSTLSRLLAAMAVTAIVPAACAQGGRPAQAVAVAPVTERSAPAAIAVVGTVLADQDATVAAEVSGPLLEFQADEGDRLVAGDLIARIDPELAELALRQAQARLASLEAELAKLEAGTRQEELDIAQAAAAEARSMYEKWQFERDRVLRLYENRQSSEKERHDTEMEYLAAKRRLAQATARLELAQSGPRQEDVEKARQDVAAQRALVSRLQRDRKKTEIRAPFAGFVTEKHTEVGEWVTEGGPICDMVAIDTVRVRADVPQFVIRYARPGADAVVMIEAIDKSIPTTVTRLIPFASRSGRTFPVEIDLANKDHLLLPGMSCTVRVPAGPTDKRLMVNKDAIVTREAPQLFVVREMGGSTMAIPVTVKLGLEDDGLVAVETAQLKPGDQVVVRANERLYGPTPVQPMPLQEYLRETPAPRNDSAAPQQADAAGPQAG